MPIEEEAEATPVKWSPAWELFELCRGEEPGPPEGPVDIDYIRALRDSHQRMRELEAFKDLMRRVRALEEQYTNEWTETKKGSEMNARAVKVLRYVRKASEFSERRCDSLLEAANRSAQLKQKGNRE